MQYTVEPLTPTLVEEVDALVAAYYEATKAHTDIPKYDFVWEVYVATEAAGKLLVCTARDDYAKLCGVALYFVADHPHHRGLRMAECDTLSVDHTQRGQGIGRGLLAYSIDQLKAAGVKLVTNRYRTCYSARPLFSDLGFDVWEHVYMKRID